MSVRSHRSLPPTRRDERACRRSLAFEALDARVVLSAAGAAAVNLEIGVQLNAVVSIERPPVQPFVDAGAPWREALGERPGDLRANGAPSGIGGYGHDRDMRGGFAPPPLLTALGAFQPGFAIAPGAIWVVVVDFINTAPPPPPVAHDAIRFPALGALESTADATSFAATALNQLSSRATTSAATGIAGLSSSLTSTGQSTQSSSPTSNGSAPFSWMPASPVVPSRGDETTTAPSAMLTTEPRDAGEPPLADGLIELETPGAENRKLLLEEEEPYGDDARRLEDAAILEWLRSEGFDAVAGEEEPAEDATPAERETADAAADHRRQASDRAANALDTEGGMIELAVEDANGDVPNPAYAAASRENLDVADVGMEAGVALFQAFELGTAPGEADGSSAAEATAESPPAEAKPATEASNRQAATLTGIGLAVAVPLAVERRRRGSHAEKDR